MLSSDLYKRNEWSDQLIEEFVVHAIIAVLSKEVIEDYYQQRPSSSTAAEGNETVQPMDEEDNDPESRSVKKPLAIKDFLDGYQDGQQFQGSFLQYFQLHQMKLQQKDRGEVFKKVLHFLQQLVLVESSFLQILVDAYVICRDRVQVMTATESETETVSKGELTSMTEETLNTFKTTIPAISQHMKDDAQIFQYLVTAETASYHPQLLQAVLKQVLTLLTTEITIPVPAKLLEVVEEYYMRTYHETLFTIEPFSDEDLSIYALLINGASLDIIEIMIPKLLKLYGESNMEEMKVYFNKLTKSRPPAMTKANLLVFLHR